jgi:exosortase
VGPDPRPAPEATSIGGDAEGVASPRNLVLLFLIMGSLFVFWTPLRTLLAYSLRQGNHDYDKYSHTLLIPFISVFLVFLERKSIFARAQYDYRIGTILLFAGLVAKGAAAPGLNQLGAENALSLQVLGLAVFWIGAFILCYGIRAFRAGAFPLLFLLLVVPIPNALIDAPLSAVRYGSTEICSLIFKLSGIPFLRNGFDFVLPSISIEVAKECSGIHSTLALLIVSLVAGHLFLAALWRKTFLVLFALPIVCFTNGLRIAGLTLLSVYVDPRFMYSDLHREGGVVFFALGLVLLFALLRLLQWGQRV